MFQQHTNVASIGATAATVSVAKEKPEKCPHSNHAQISSMETVNTKKTILQKYSDRELSSRS